MRNHPAYYKRPSSLTREEVTSQPYFKKTRRKVYQEQRETQSRGTIVLTKTKKGLRERAAKKKKKQNCVMGKNGVIPSTHPSWNTEAVKEGALVESILTKGQRGPVREEDLRASHIHNSWASCCVPTLGNLEQLGKPCSAKTDTKLHLGGYWFLFFFSFLTFMSKICISTNLPHFQPELNVLMSTHRLLIRNGQGLSLKNDPRCFLPYGATHQNTVRTEGRKHGQPRCGSHQKYPEELCKM